MSTVSVKYDVRTVLGGEDLILTNPATPATYPSVTKKDDQIFVIGAALTDEPLWDGSADGPLGSFEFGLIVLLDGGDVGTVTLELFDGSTAFDVTLRENVPFLLDGTGISRLRVTNADATNTATVRRCLFA